MILFLPRLRPASLSAETRRLSAEMKVPSAEVEKSQASALSGGVTKRGNLCAVLYSTVQNLLFVIKKEKIKNVTRTGGAPHPAPPRSCYVFDVFFFL